MAFTDGWEDIGGGEKVYEDGELLVLVRPDLEGWVLQCDHPEFRWYASSCEGLAGPFNHLRKYFTEVEMLETRPEHVIRRPIQDDLTIVGNREPDGYFRVLLLDKEGQRLGRYDGGINTPLASYVLGCLTIQGGAFLNDDHRGKGIANMMRDVAEEVMGLPAVPHGRNLSPGSLSPLASKSWERRAISRHVPGLHGDVAIDIRKKLAEESEKFFKKRHWIGRASLSCTKAFAAEIGWDVAIGMLHEKPVFGWAVTPAGLPICPRGNISEKRLFEVLTQGEYEKTKSNISMIRLSAAEAIEFLKDVEIVHKDDFAFVTDIITRFHNGTLPKPLPSVFEHCLQAPEATLK